MSTTGSRSSRSAPTTTEAALAVLEVTTGGMRRIATYLGYSGSCPAARDLYRSIVDALKEDEAYGADNAYTLTARDGLVCE
jgi:hypothetical protein